MYRTLRYHLTPSPWPRSGDDSAVRVSELATLAADADRSDGDRLDVLLTVDTEASIAGTFADPQRNAPILHPMVAAEVDARSEGLGFLLRTLADCRLRATFFVEALQTRYFGTDPMRRYVDEIAAGGQDVQLHVHPCWRNFAAGRLLSTAPADHSTGRPVDELRQIFEEAVQHFEAWGQGAPVAVRTGSFSVGLDTYRALEDAGLRIASNVSLALNPPQDPALHFHYHYQRVGGVLEVPLTPIATYRVAGQPAFRPLTITACSTEEFTGALRQASQQRFDMVCLLTHPFEFVTRDRDSGLPRRVNATNQRRFRDLCAFLSNNPQRYRVITFSDLARREQVPIGRSDGSLRGSYLSMLRRSAANLLTDHIG